MRTHRAILTLLILTSCGLAPSAYGQASPPVRRVRIIELSEKRVLIVGQLVRLTNDSVLILPDGGAGVATPQPFVLGRPHRLEESRGVRGRALAGAGIGLVVGAGIGALWGRASYREPDCGSQVGGCWDFGRDFAAVSGALLLGIPMAVVGAGVGQTIKHEVWRPIADRKLRVAIVPTARRGLQLAGSMAF